MNKKVLLIHRILYALNAAMLGASLVFYLIKWKDLPESIGMHFNGNGEYDVIGEKIYGFYPHLVGGLILIACGIAAHIIQKKSTGLKISEKGERIFRCEILLTLDVFLFMWMSFFSLWSRSVALQIPRSDGIFTYIEGCTMLLMTVGIIAQVVTCIKYRQKDKAAAKSTGVSHRLCRLAAWLWTIGAIGVLLEAWDRHPGSEELYFDPEYDGLAYFANFDAYLDKHLLIIPHAVIILLLVIFELLSAKFAKRENAAALSLLDKLKLICGSFFFWWVIKLNVEEAVGLVSVCIFLVLCILSFVKYRLDVRKKLLHTEVI